MCIRDSEKIDHLLDTYARKLAENMNQGFAIDARVPSVLIAGPSNFPVGKKEKQNRARDSNMEEWRYIQGLLDKIRSTGMGGISADDPAAIEKLQKKLDRLERSQLIMKEVNAYYRKHGKLDGCALLCLFGKLFDTGLYPADFRIVVGKLVAFKGPDGFHDKFQFSLYKSTTKIQNSRNSNPVAAVSFY